MNRTLKHTAKSRFLEYLASKVRTGINHVHGLLFAVTRLGLASMTVFLVPLCHAMLPPANMPIELAGSSASDATAYTSTISEPLSLISMSSTSTSPDGCNLNRL